MVDRVLGENAADREPGVPRPNDDRRDALDGGLPRRQVLRDRPLNDLDRHVGRIGHDIVYRRAFLRLRDQRLDLFL